MVTDALETLGLVTGDEAVVQRLVLDSLLTQLTLGILVAVQTQLGGVGKIGAELEEEGTEFWIQQYQ